MSKAAKLAESESPAPESETEWYDRVMRERDARQPVLTHIPLPVRDAAGCLTWMVTNGKFSRGPVSGDWNGGIDGSLYVAVKGKDDKTEFLYVLRAQDVVLAVIDLHLQRRAAAAIYAETTDQ